MNDSHRYDDDYDLLIPGFRQASFRSLRWSGNYRGLPTSPEARSAIPRWWDCEWCGGQNRDGNADCHVCGAPRGAGREKLRG
ncbi:MAG: hypothetical protein HY685_02205 [Chloroflexi bacterium]|nr:hypothetical protein [Chloroflexota bacterium]